MLSISTGDGEGAATLRVGCTEKSQCIGHGLRCSRTRGNQTLDNIAAIGSERRCTGDLHRTLQILELTDELPVVRRGGIEGNGVTADDCSAWRWRLQSSQLDCSDDVRRSLGCEIDTLQLGTYDTAPTRWADARSERGQWQVDLHIACEKTIAQAESNLAPGLSVIAKQLAIENEAAEE